MRKIVAIAACIALLTCTIFLTSCTTDSEGVIFGTYFSIEYKGALSQKKRQALKEYLPSLEAEVASSYEDSFLYKINSSKADNAIIVSEDVAHIYELAIRMYQETNGAFNPSTFPLIELWKFSPDTFIGAANSIPSQSEIERALSLCNPSFFSFDKEAMSISKTIDDAKLDFGGIAKGYAVDRVYEMLSNYGVHNIVVDIGGTFKISSPIKLYIANPRGSGYVASANLQNVAVATSGDYERYYIINDVRYHHIIAKNGYPSGLGDINAPISVTVWGESAAICDALSTAVMIMGYQESIPILNKLGYSALILTEHGYYTIGDETFEILDNRQKLN